MRLSVLDQSPIRKDGNAADAVAETIALARACDRLGYHRYWLAEHHNSNSFAGSCPEILIGRVASETHGIRVGSGGVMLTHYSPLKIAEQFRMLEVLNPGRIDLGLGRAPARTRERPRRCRPARRAGASTRSRARSICCASSSTTRRSVSPCPPIIPIAASTRCRARRPPRARSSGCWARASTARSMPASSACRSATPISSARREARTPSPPIANVFKPSAACVRPVVSLGVAALVAETEGEAQALAASRNLWVVRLLTGRPIPFPPPDEAQDYPFTEQELALLAHGPAPLDRGNARSRVRTGLLALAEAHGRRGARRRHDHLRLRLAAQIVRIAGRGVRAQPQNATMRKSSAYSVRPATLRPTIGARTLPDFSSQ